MDKEKNTRLPLVDLIEVKPMQDGYRWVAITAMLFAIGIILHTVCLLYTSDAADE